MEKVKNSLYIDVNEAVETIRNGGMIIMTDDEERENEGDLLQAASLVTAESMTFMAVHGRGLICMPMAREEADRLSLAPMVTDNDSLHETAFTVSIDAKEGTTTGISAADRAVTVNRAADPSSLPGDFARPGHIFPLIAKQGGVLERDGHTEASVDLLRLAGLAPVAVICEIMDTDGTMARGGRLEEYAAGHGLKILAMEKLKKHLEAVKKSRDKSRVTEMYDQESFIRVALPTEYGIFTLLAESANRNAEGRNREETQAQNALFTLLSGTIDPEKEVIVRIHSECVTGDILHSLRCDCGRQLEKSLRIIAEKGGLLIYMKQEGRGIGFTEKIKAYRLQEMGADTVEANIMLGHSPDLRHYDRAAEMLKKLGVRKIRLLTNNPEKIRHLQKHGFESIVRERLEVEPNIHNRNYLLAKKEKMGHLLNAG